jgi:hypothetical protein
MPLSPVSAVVWRVHVKYIDVMASVKGIHLDEHCEEGKVLIRKIYLTVSHLAVVAQQRFCDAANRTRCRCRPGESRTLHKSVRKKPDRSYGQFLHLVKKLHFLTVPTRTTSVSALRRPFAYSRGPY